MKSVIFVCLISIVVGCWSKKPNEEEAFEKIRKTVSKEVLQNTEKLLLLANIEEIEFEKAEIIIREYLIVILDRKSKLETQQDYASLIKSISKKVGLPEKKVSSIIFSYSYEMRTKSEIGEQYLHELNQSKEDYAEPGDIRRY
ncbi:MAG: hypothetical protein ACK514_09845 [Bacteroidota bacterium]|jgi:hypothetical protein|nr:hypothetical protein [Cytophagales bacterium]MCE2956188.1 hypothetical protein [Flammeovirgaceae bacterium]MCZ8071411.1 hypothetical protein [Cytophagales bacterium]